jgi:hypothetical protein
MAKPGQMFHYVSSLVLDGVQRPDTCRESLLLSVDPLCTHIARMTT